MSSLYPNPENNKLASPQAVKNVLQINYILQIVGAFTAGLILLVPLFLGYKFRRENDDALWDSHFRWQIQSFWITLPLFGLSWFFALIPILGTILGWFVFIPAIIILFIRSVRGLVRFARQLPPQG
jgi:uncharacterized membrane protein